MTRPLYDRARSVLITVVAALLLGAVGYGAMPQVGKPTPKSSPRASPPSGDLQQQVAAQERRIQQLEERLAVLDQARAAGDAVARNAPEDRVMTVKAPFVVLDAKNKPIMRVQDTDNSLGRGIYVFQAGAALPMAHVGVLGSGGGRVYVANVNATRPEAQMFVTAKGGAMETYAADGSHRLVLVDHQGLSVMNSKDVIVGNIGVLGDRGAFEINNAAGEKMVTAGSTSNGKGVVQANPAHVLEAIENPSVLIGGSGKK